MCSGLLVLVYYKRRSKWLFVSREGDIKSVFDCGESVYYFENITVAECLSMNDLTYRADINRNGTNVAIKSSFSESHNYSTISSGAHIITIIHESL